VPVVTVPYHITLVSIVPGLAKTSWTCIGFPQVCIPHGPFQPRGSKCGPLQQARKEEESKEQSKEYRNPVAQHAA
jgi:hypothetical protein